jgi:hypothetical protein
MQLKRTTMRSRNHGHAGHHPHQHAEGVTAAHVRVDQLNSIVADPVGDPLKFKRASIEFRLDELNRRIDVLLQPPVRAAQDRDLMSARHQLFGNELAIRKRTIDVAARNDLQDLQLNCSFYELTSRSYQLWQNCAALVLLAESEVVFCLPVALIAKKNGTQ